MNKFFELRADNEESVSTVHRHRSKVILCNSSHFLYTNIKISCCLLDGEHILLTNRKRFIAFCLHSISPSDKVVTQLTPLYYFSFFVIFTLILWYLPQGQSKSLSPFMPGNGAAPSRAKTANLNGVLTPNMFLGRPLTSQDVPKYSWRLPDIIVFNLFSISHNYYRIQTKLTPLKKRNQFVA